MHVGLVVPGFSADSSDWCIPALRDLVSELATVDDLWILALRYPAPAHSYSVFGASVQALGGGIRSRGQAAVLWGSAFAAIATQHRLRRFDVLHAFWADETGAIAAMAGRILGVPTIVSIAGGELVGFRDIAYGSQITLGGRVKVDLALRLASVVTGGSRYVVDLATPRLAGRTGSPVRQLPLGVDVRRFELPERSHSAIRDGQARLFHAASLVPIKDQPMLLRTVRRLQGSGVPFTLEVAGEGPLAESLRRTSGDLGLSSAVRFLGSVPHDQLAAHYRASTAFVLTSRHEAQCLAALEAAACGVPVIGTRVGVLPELAPAANMVVGVGDDRALADALKLVLGDDSARLAASEAAIAKVETDFRLDRCAEGFRALYREVATRR